MQRENTRRSSCEPPPGSSVRSAGKWQRGLLPAERKSPRTWRTRPDPFTGIWTMTSSEPLLRRDPESALQATNGPGVAGRTLPGTVQPGPTPDATAAAFGTGVFLHGPEQEVLQILTVHPPGRELPKSRIFYRRRRTAESTSAVDLRVSFARGLLRVHPSATRGGDSIGQLQALRRDL